MRCPDGRREQNKGGCWPFFATKMNKKCFHPQTGRGGSWDCRDWLRETPQCETFPGSVCCSLVGTDLFVAVLCLGRWWFRRIVHWVRPNLEILSKSRIEIVDCLFLVADDDSVVNPMIRNIFFDSLVLKKRRGVYLSLREVLLFDEVRESLSPDPRGLFEAINKFV